MTTIRGIVSEYSVTGAEEQRAFIEEISGRLAGYTGGLQFKVLEYEINKTELFLPDESLSDASDVTLSIRIEIKD